MTSPLTHHTLAQALLAALRDSLAAAPRFDPSPNIDLAVLALPAGGPPVWANVLCSRDFPDGLVADIGADAGPVRNIRYLADARGPDGTSLAWVAGSDWRQLPAGTFAPLAGQGEHRFIAPYPASLLKLMVAVGVAHLVDSGRARWHERWPHGAAQGDLAPTLAQWCQPMIETSSNEATSALVALLHQRGLVVREGWVAGQPDSGVERHNGLHALLHANGLHTLRLANTKPDGGWFNRSGAGVGQLQMTAWDTVRLLWRLSEPLPDAPGMPTHDPDAIAPPAPWLAPGTPPLLSADSRARLWQWLAGQALHEVLSSTLHAGSPGWQPGIPARLPERWIQADGSVLAAGTRYTGDVRAAQASASCLFAHKTGNTASYSADAGRVLGLGPGPGTGPTRPLLPLLPPGPSPQAAPMPPPHQAPRYLVALQTTLGQRHAPAPQLATDWVLPRLGARLHQWLAEQLR